MYKNKKIGIVIPAYNEELLIEQTITTLPDFVDNIIVIDDVSNDKTVEIVNKVAATNSKIILLCHQINRGVGGAISTGYIWCRENDIDIAVVMAGDGQMDPADLPALLEPVVDGKADYSKGNRLVTGEAWEKIPHARYLGNSALSLLTKIASGYWHVTDSQTGYTALNKKALHTVPIEDIFPRYGMPNDFLVTLNIYNMRVVDVPIEPVYDIGEKSGFKPHKVLLPLFWLVTRLFFRRMIQKYIIRDFHPLVFFYTFGFVLLVPGFFLGIYLIFYRFLVGTVSFTSALFAVFLFVSGFQSILFAMLFDMEANKELKATR